MLQERQVAVVAPYDEVAEDEESRKPTRKAPPVPVNKVNNLSDRQAGFWIRVGLIWIRPSKATDPSRKMTSDSDPTDKKNKIR